MIKTVVAVGFTKSTDRGRTKPSFLECEAAGNSYVEVVAKFSHGCDQRELNLAREAIASCLAADLGLPVPEPFLVEFDASWPATVPDADRRQIISSSVPVAFGSRVMTEGYTAWRTGTTLFDEMLQTAASIFVFDAIVQNADRRDENPNCLVLSNQIRIFDHELTFAHGLILGWKPPWVLDGLKVMETSGFHIFRQKLRNRTVDYADIKMKWTALSDAQIDAYTGCLPACWQTAQALPEIARALKLIKDARDNIDGCLTEVQRVLE